MTSSRWTSLALWLLCVVALAGLFYGLGTLSESLPFGWGFWGIPLAITFLLCAIVNKRWMVLAAPAAFYLGYGLLEATSSRPFYDVGPLGWAIEGFMWVVVPLLASGSLGFLGGRSLRKIQRRAHC